jgi:hypothetical protein
MIGNQDFGMVIWHFYLKHLVQCVEEQYKKE